MKFDNREVEKAQSGPLLEVKGLSVSYGGVRAVQEVALTVGRGELVSLIGANGAGKSSTLNAIAGVSVRNGDVHFNGASTDRKPAHMLVKEGLALVPEGRGIFTRMTVRENLMLGADIHKNAAARDLGIEEMFSSFPRLRERSSQLAGSLSGGEQQMLAIARALLSQPKLLLLDEPSMGLSPIATKAVFDIVRKVNRQGVAVLLVEQNAKLALKMATRAYVMESSRIVMSGAAADLLEDPAVRSAYLGTAA